MVSAKIWIRLAATVAATMLIGNGAALAGSGATTMRQGGASAQLMATYKKTSLDKYRSSVGGSTAASDLPPTDCPPEPVQVCRDSWKPKIINPFPGKDIKTINPFE